MATVRRRPVAVARPSARPWLALGALAGPVLFTLGWFVLEGYVAGLQLDDQEAFGEPGHPALDTFDGRRDPTSCSRG